MFLTGRCATSSFDAPRPLQISFQTNPQRIRIDVLVRCSAYGAAAHPGEYKYTLMAPISVLGCSRSLRSALFCGLVAGALALPTTSNAVVFCTPSAGEAPILKVSPAAVPPPDNGKYGFKLKTTVDGCVADTASLNTWIPSKNGTADGGLIAKAELTLTVAGYGNCGLGILSGNPAAYPASGTMKLKWLDAAGDTIKSAKTTSAYVLISGISVTAEGFTAIGNGVVTKGLGVGASVYLRIPLDMNFADPFSNPWSLCMIGGLPGIPGIPDLPAATPLKQLPMKGRPSVSIGFPAFP